MTSSYDTALAQHYLSADPDFIACLSSKCGRYFSTQDCSDGNKRNTNQKIACPYCEYELCFTCNRPWHGKTGCSKAKEREDQESLEQIKIMGAKPCPSCGINIEKQGGCDHMTCHRCHHGFCWQCLVPYTSNVVHLDSCPHGRRDVAVDPDNWAPANATPAQINALIAQAQRRLENPSPQGHALAVRAVQPLQNEVAAAVPNPREQNLQLRHPQPAAVLQPPAGFGIGAMAFFQTFFG
jgi:hypothetical protein